MSQFKKATSKDVNNFVLIFRIQE